MNEQNATHAEMARAGLQLEYWPLDRLIPYARNARTHSPAQVAEIAGSIRAFGFSNPILVGEGADIIAGHGRLAAARRLGLTEAPVIVLRGLTEVQRRQLAIADNRIAMNAGWDSEMLSLARHHPVRDGRIAPSCLCCSGGPATTSSPRRH